MKHFILFLFAWSFFSPRHDPSETKFLRRAVRFFFPSAWFYVFFLLFIELNSGTGAITSALREGTCVVGVRFKFLEQSLQRPLGLFDAILLVGNEILPFNIAGHCSGRVE